MGTIVTFPQSRDDTSDDFSFVSDGETLNFDDDCAGIRLAPQPADQDWSNQELADLYRVEHLLGRAGIATETDRGTSDEGDPWFVFMRADGEVFIHFCRIDGTYHLDSPSLEHALRGPDFRALVDDYTLRIAGARSGLPGHGGNVVSLKARGGQVSLHPAAMLAALVWSLLLGAEDLSALPSGGQAHVPDMPDTPDFDALSQPGPGAPQATDDLPELPGGSGEPGWTFAQATFSLRDPSQATFNGYATGLSAVAIGIGVLSDHGLGLLGDAPFEQIFLQLEMMSDPLASASPDSDPSAAREASRIDPLDLLIDIAWSSDGTGPLRDPNLAEGAMPAQSEAALLADPAQLPEGPYAAPLQGLPAWHDLALEDQSLGHEVTDFVPKAESSPASGRTSETAAQSASAPSAAAPAQPEAEGGQSIEMMTPVKAAPSAFSAYTSALDFSAFTLGGTVYHASFEVTEALLEKFGLLQDEVSAPQEDMSQDISSEMIEVFLNMPDTAAKTALRTLIEQGADLEMADSGAWLWFVEADAQYAPLADTVSMTYQTDDGSKVMITGLQSTLIDLDLGVA